MGLRDVETAFWAWRQTTAPDGQDDLTRMPRPPGWVPDWSSAAIEARRTALRDFRRAHEALDLSGEPVGVRVDGRLLGCAIARVHWELELVRAWQTNPCFYLDQSLGAVYPLLLPPPPFDNARAEAVVARLDAITVVLAHARENLTGHGAAPFARAAWDLLAHAPDDLRTAMASLAPLLPESWRPGLARATAEAAGALAGYRDWLAAQLPRFGGAVAAGPQAFAFFLHRVALLPYQSEEIFCMGRQEWHRAVSAEAVLANRLRGVPEPALPVDSAAQIARQAGDERRIREFYVERGLLGQPESLRHYRFAEIPGYVAPLSWLGVTDDLASPARLGDDAVRYVPPPRPGLPYFARAAAQDPRLAIVHEGVHAQQLALSWAHPNPARRRFYDSTPNEGIAFYNEELMLLSGLFDDSPHSARTIASFLRLRALRVEVDVALATGELGIEQAAARLETAVPLDAATAVQEAVFFAGNPGQAMSYLVGKLQIQSMLAEAAGRDGFTLRAFHDRLWREGNVPLALQRWESLGLHDEVERADRLAERATW